MTIRGRDDEQPRSHTACGTVDESARALDMRRVTPAMETEPSARPLPAELERWESEMQDDVYLKAARLCVAAHGPSRLNNCGRCNGTGMVAPGDYCPACDATEDFVDPEQPDRDELDARDEASNEYFLAFADVLIAVGAEAERARIVAALRAELSKDTNVREIAGFIERGEIGSAR